MLPSYVSGNYDGRQRPNYDGEIDHIEQLNQKYYE